MKMVTEFGSIADLDSLDGMKDHRLGKDSDL